MEQTPAAPLRSNARRNRERILEVAHEALTASSTASLNSIAKQAGVGIATVYRHFPSREALVLAVYRYEVQQVVEAAPILLETHTPVDALREWMRRLARYGMTKHGLADALSATNARAESYGPVIGAISMLLQACERDGSIRPGVKPKDLMLAMSGLFRMDPNGEWQAQAGRLIDLLIDGLRAGAPAPKTGIDR